ncbi:MAG: 4Fe-4S dicluster domain-containing protein [Candidatus Omnitrophica bacterium]|nr:4Fe-4S dicluster domain-containing protein [Candidatus Omnitrophota bacterium]
MPAIKINKERCKGCGLCVMVCPKGLIAPTGPFNRFGLKVVKFKGSRDCSGCAFCAIVCPDCAITVWR